MELHFIMLTELSHLNRFMVSLLMELYCLNGIILHNANGSILKLMELSLSPSVRENYESAELKASRLSSL